jgi:hypothetical protein
VLNDHFALGQPLGARGGDVVEPDHVEHCGRRCEDAGILPV